MIYFLILINLLNNLIVFTPLCFKRKNKSKFLVSCIFLFLCFVSGLPDLVFSENLPEVELTVKGGTRLKSGVPIPAEGFNVVLLKLVINAEGKVTPLGPKVG